MMQPEWCNYLGMLVAIVSAAMVTWFCVKDFRETFPKEK